MLSTYLTAQKPRLGSLPDPNVLSGLDLVYVDVLSPAPRVVMRCTSIDAGRILVPQGSIAGIEEGQVAVHRLHKESFKAKGIEPGEVRFDVAKIVTFRR